MQGKVKLASNAASSVYVGIDVCKAYLDVFIHPTGEAFRVANDAGGWRRLKARLSSLAVTRVVMEATGKYHRAAHSSLTEAGLSVAIVNPLRARLFAEACGALAKTDAIDARLLALMAEGSIPRRPSRCAMSSRKSVSSPAPGVPRSRSASRSNSAAPAP